MKLILFITMILLLSMCQPAKQIPQNVQALAPLIIYKTKGDYSNNIPVVLNLSKDNIQSYPAMGDIYFNGKFARPECLENGYLLDHFGLSPQSAYTSFTFEEYAKLEKVPTLKELMDRIIDDDPFIEMYHYDDRIDMMRELRKGGTRKSFIIKKE